MNLISALCAGMAGAANGHAEIYIRDTSTRATYYLDFEGTQPVSSGANVTLDAYGATEVYVNQLVDITVKDEDGNTVRSFTDGYASPNVEVISPAFTGTDYVTAASAVNEPTTLQAVLNLWVTNNGSPDWKVLVSGAATTIQSALGPLVGLVYNVKSPAYGGVGDGVASDQAAFSAAHAAAVAAGGGIVFLPKGTYRLTAAIAWSPLVHIVGVPGLSIITMDSAATKTLRYTSATSSSMPTVVYGVTFQSSQSNTGTIVDLEAASRMLFSQCYFGGNTNAVGTQIDVNASGTYITCEDCVFNVRSATLPAITTDSATTGNWAAVRDCTFIGPASFTGAWCDLRYTSQAFVSGNHFDGATNSTGGTNYCVQVGTGHSTISGNRFEGGVISFCIRVVGTGGGNHSVSITGNTFSNYTGILECTAAAMVRMVGNATGGSYLYTLADVLLEGSYLELEPLRRVALTAAGTIPNAVEVVAYNATDTVPTLTMPDIYYPGQRLQLQILNESGAPWATNVLFSGSYQLYGSTDTTATNGEPVFVDFVASDFDTEDTYVWVGTSVKLNSA